MRGEPTSLTVVLARESCVGRAPRGWTWGLVVALAAAGCGETDAPAARPDATSVTDPPSDDDPVWITTGLDSLALVRRVLGADPPMRTIPGQADLVALLVPRAALAPISEAEHALHDRCGGFVLHASEQDAMDVRSGRGRARNKQAPSYTVDNAATVSALLSALSDTHVLATVRKLSSYETRFHTTATAAEAVLWLSETWRELAQSRADIEVETIEHMGTPQPSLKVTIRGAHLHDEIVVLGGHVDSVGGDYSPALRSEALTMFATLPAPGADDNAAGIAVLTELLRAAVEVDYRPARTVVFYAYAAEEVGLVGSGEIARQARQQNQDVVGVMQLDMINFTSAPEPYITFVRNGTDVALNDFAIALVEQYVHLPYRYRDCAYACSDYASWTDQGFPSTFPNEAAGGDRNPHAHTAQDTLAWTHDGVEHAMYFAQLGAAFMAELGKGQLGPALAVGDTNVANDAGAVQDAGVDEDVRRQPRDGGCSLRGTPQTGSAWAVLLVLILLVRRRRALSIARNAAIRDVCPVLDASRRKFPFWHVPHL